MCKYCEQTDVIISSNYKNIGADLRFDVENRQLENNAETCLMEHDAEHAQMYLDYATGVRMVLDNIKILKENEL